MIRIDDSLLEELGLASLPKAERDALLRQIYETLEMRVGMRLAERMSDQQLDEFERFIDGDMAFTEDYLTNAKPEWQNSEAYKTAVVTAQQTAEKRGAAFNENAVKSEFGALTWLETNFPDYKQVVASELDKLKGEVKVDADKILMAASQQAAAPGAQPQMQQPDPYAQPMPQQPMQDPAQGMQQPAAPSVVPPQQPTQQPGDGMQSDFQQSTPQPPLQDDPFQQPPAQAA